MCWFGEGTSGNTYEQAVVKPVPSQGSGQALSLSKGRSRESLRGNFTMTTVADAIATGSMSPQMRHTRLARGPSRLTLPAWRGGVAADRIPLWQPTR